MTYLGLVGPGVKHLGIDGWGPAQGPNSAGPNSGQTVSADLANPGTWADHTDIEPTELYLTGLKADYTQDGTVITDVLTDAPPHLRSVPERQLAACYKQLNASVGQFGAATLIASTKAVESSTAGDAKYNQVNAALLSLEKQRDALAIKVKDELNAAAFSNTADRRPARAGCAVPGHHRPGEAAGTVRLTGSLGRTHGGAGAEWASDFCASPS